MDTVVTQAPSQALSDARPASQAAPPAQAVGAVNPPQNTDALRGMSLVDAVATLGSRNSMVTQMILGADNQVSSVRVLDSVTHKVIAECPPDSIARAQQEMLAYQDLAQAQKRI
jgi:hypothetical protein